MESRTLAHSRGWTQRASLLSILAVVVLAARIFVEERFLTENLDGYDAYRKRVRYRLIPLLW